MKHHQTLLAAVAVILSAASATAGEPKKRIAVARFDATPDVLMRFPSTDLGAAMAAQLATELVKTGRWIVIERPLLNDVLRESELAGNKASAAETAPPPGRLLGAQFLVAGTITEFSQTAGDKGIGASLGGLSSIVPSLGAAYRRTTAHVGLDIRVIHTATGQVLLAERAAAKVSGNSVSGSYSKKGIVEAQTSQEPPLGIAIRRALQQAVSRIAEEADHLPWTARVIGTMDGKVYINAGLDAGIHAGDVLEVSEVAAKLIDPDTGLELGTVEHKAGLVRIESVEEKYSVATPLSAKPAKRGDLVRWAKI